MLDFPSGADFLLLPTLYVGLDGLLFDYGRKDMPLYVTVNFFLLFL